MRLLLLRFNSRVIWTCNLSSFNRFSVVHTSLIYLQQSTLCDHEWQTHDTDSQNYAQTYLNREYFVLILLSVYRLHS